MIRLRRVEAPEVAYPDDLTFWEKEIPDSERLKIVNPGDFPKDEILDSLGLSKSSLVESFGINNEDEIRNRLELMQFLDANPEYNVVMWSWCTLDKNDDDINEYLTNMNLSPCSVL